MFYNLSPHASDQLRETTENVNSLLRTNSISLETAQKLIDAARLTEGMSQYLGLPLENGSGH